MAETVDPELELLLTYIRTARGFDFGEYKPASLPGGSTAECRPWA